jgi:hypothetical protein
MQVDNNINFIEQKEIDSQDLIENNKKKMKKIIMNHTQKRKK